MHNVYKIPISQLNVQIFGIASFQEPKIMLNISGFLHYPGKDINILSHPCDSGEKWHLWPKCFCLYWVIFKVSFWHARWVMQELRTEV